MTPTKLTGLSNILLSGALALVVVGLSSWANVVSLMANLANSEIGKIMSSGIVIFVFVTALLLLGMFVDSIANMTVRPIVKWSLQHERVSRFFRIHIKRKRALQYRALFLRTVSKNSAYRDIVKHEEEHGPALFSASYFLRFANASESNWVLGHYNNYRLSCNFVLLLILAVPGSGARVLETGATVSSLLGIATGYMILVYAILAFASIEYLHVVQYMLSQASIHAAQELSGEPAEKEVSDAK